MITFLSVAWAELWCAEPLLVHEWGVAVIGEKSGVELPAWFLRQGPVAHSQPVATWTLPADGGERALPLVQFHGRANAGPIPVGLEVGFREGRPSAWYPQVDALTSDGRAGPGVRDASRQLHWANLTVGGKRSSQSKPSSLAWVKAARGVDALPVNDDAFVFYEADTVERSDVVVRTGPTAAHHVVLENTGAFDVHDVVFLRDGRMWMAPKIPAGRSAGFLLEEAHDAGKLKSWLSERWTNRSGLPARDWSAECVMQRDPAVAVEIAEDHRMFPDELAVFWTVWEPMIESSKPVRIIYREDTAALAVRMPISVYSDMHNDPRLSRLGVVFVP